VSDIRILIADDHALIRAGLREVVGAERGLEIVGEVASYTELWEALKADPPTVLLLDMRMPGGQALDAVRRLDRDHPHVRVIVLTSYSEEGHAARMIAAGAAGFLQKDAAPEEIIRAIRLVAQGEAYVSERGGRALARSLGRGRAGGSGPATLSDREFQVLRLICDGHTPTEIGAQLHLSAKTVSTYRHRILQKLELTTTSDLVRFAREQGMTD
jgi:two-component system invasion response regulator UvrY